MKSLSHALGLFCLLFTGTGTGFAQRYPKLADQKFYGTAQEDNPTCFVRDAEGNLYIFGSMQDAHGRTDCLVIKLDTAGRQVWLETWGGFGHEQINDAVISRTGEIFFAGATGSGIAHPDDPFWDRKADYYIGQISPDGRRLWTRTIGGSGRDVAHGIALTTFDGIVVTGMSWSANFDVGSHNLMLNNQWVVILSKDGRLLRSKVFGGKKNDWGADCDIMPDGGIMAAGVTNSEDLDMAEARHNGDAWFMKLDFAGNMQWSQIVRKPFEDIVYNAFVNRYGLTIAVGSRVTPEKGKQFWLMKLDERGRVVMDILLGDVGFEELLAVDVCQDGGIVMAGYSEYLDINTPGTKGLRDVWVVRTGPNGEVIWKESYGGPANEMGVDVMEYAPGVIKVLCQKANTFNNPHGDTKMDAWVLTIRDLPCQDFRLDIVTDMIDPRTQVGVPIKFINRSVAGDRFEWDFGNGTTSAERSPIVVYRQPGVYTVRVIASINNSCRTVYVYPKPVIISP